MSKETEKFLTTFDNPFNPFKDFEIWWKTDMRLGHNCCGLLAITANTSTIVSDEINEEKIKEAMNEIVSRWPTIYRVVKPEDYHSLREVKVTVEQ